MEEIILLSAKRRVDAAIYKAANKYTIFATWKVAEFSSGHDLILKALNNFMVKHIDSKSLYINLPGINSW